MNTQFSFIIISALLFCCCFACQTEQKSSANVEETVIGEPVFVLRSPSETNVDFINTLEEGLNTNVLMYEYFYNGGGVAVGDFNGDELLDLYFTSNMGGNKLYLNRGNLKFEEVTAQTKAGGRSGPWKTGVAVVDINGDSRLDIYLCYSGAVPEEKRQNQLFINQGNNAEGIPIFEEQAASYGLNSPAFSNQAYFLDYDLDGDLDMLLLNHNPKSLPVLNETNSQKMMAQDDPLQGVRLYENRSKRFFDITSKAGVSGSPLTYGLGLGIADLNNDGWPDFYVSNDYTIPDYLYLNNQDGTFTNTLSESIGHSSHFSMGNDIADINNDGLQDIVTLDMLPEDNKRQKLLMAPDNYSKFDLNVRSGFHYQYMRNMLQLNNGNGTFSEIGQLAGISNTDWSWAALLADYNNDGWKDLYVTNGYFRDYTNLDFINYMDNFVKSKGRLQRTDVMELINNMPASDLENYLFENQGGLKFKNVTKQWGGNQIANSNGAAYADLDNDGDLELIINNINKPAFIYENKIADNNYLQIKTIGAGQNTVGIGAVVEIHANGKTQRLEQYTGRGYLSVVSPILHFGLGTVTMVDSLVIVWPSGKREKVLNVASNQRLVLKEKNATSKEEIVSGNVPTNLFQSIKSPVAHENPKLYLRDFDRQSLLLTELSHTGPCMAKADFNGDGLTDVFIGGSSGQAAAIYFQSKSGTFVLQENFVAIAQADAKSEDSEVVIFDANGDNYLDIYVGSGGYHFFRPNDAALQDRLYLNDGKGNFSKNTEALPQITNSTGAVAVGDVNEDGYLDIFVGSRLVPGRWPESPKNYLLINDGTGKYTEQIEVIAPGLASVGMITDAVWADLNQDDQADLVVVGEWMPVGIFLNTGGKLVDKTSDYFDKTYLGWWNKIAISDFNSDGKVDLLLGNQGTNTQFQATDETPVDLVHKDFDENGSVDPFFCYYIQGKSYPYVTRDELLRQLAPLRSKFTSYKSYADATLKDVFEKKELSTAKRLQANHLATTLFLSTLDGGFKEMSLPVQAQYAPIHAIHLFDYNEDGNIDALLCGNDSRAKLRLGRADANHGVLLQGRGNGKFKYISQTRSGFQLKGDVKSILQLNDLLLFGINQQKIQAYQLN